MSTQRRRVLEDGGLIIPADGVYIEGLDGKAYTVDKWQGGNTANSVIVASGDIKCRMALTEAPSTMQISSSCYEPLENYMTAVGSIKAAIANFDGAGNTTNILKVQPNTGYAAGYCNAFVFPDGKTKGFLPSYGQIYLAFKNKAAVDAALSACGGTAMKEGVFNYWSSTFYKYSNCRACSAIFWGHGMHSSFTLDEFQCVRPFADIS